MKFKKMSNGAVVVEWDDGEWAGEIYRPRQVDGVVVDLKTGSISTNQLEEILNKMKEMESVR